MKQVIRFSSVLLMISFVFACTHDNGTAPTSVRKWDNIIMKAAFESPAPAGRNEEGEANIELMSDNSLKFDFHLHNLSPSDALTAAHIHFGDPATAGPVLINFNPSFSGPGASGTVTGLRQGQIDTLLNMPVYVNVHSTQLPGGLVRGQIGKVIEFAMDIPLSGLNEVPANVTTATGNAVLRLGDDDTLYSLVTVTGVEALDTLTVSHIHRGAIGTNGPVRIFLASSLADFGVVKKAFLVDSLVNIVKNDPSYVNVHSKTKPAGKIRGPIR